MTEDDNSQKFAQSLYKIIITTITCYKFLIWINGYWEVGKKKEKKKELLLGRHWVEAGHKGICEIAIHSVFSINVK